MKQDLKENPMEDPVGINEEYGECLFCGQMIIIKPLLEWGAVQINEEATRICHCEEAENQRKGIQTRDSAKKAILRMLDGRVADESSAVVKILNSAVEVVLSDQVKNIVVDFDGGKKIKVSKNSKGMLKIEDMVSIKKAFEG